MRHLTVYSIAQSFLIIFGCVFFHTYLLAEDAPHVNLVRVAFSNNVDVLEKTFTQLIDDYHNKDKDELQLYYRFEVFLNSDPNFLEKLHAWLIAYPNSVPAKLALARHHLHLGWLSRGGQWRSNTQDQQFEAMYQHFELANNYYSEVVTQDPEMVLAYYGMLSILMNVGNEKLTDQVVDQAMEAIPDSYVFNLKRLLGLQPKWGGSLEAIRNEIKALKKHYRTNPKLRWIEGFENYAVANEILREEKNKSTCLLAKRYIDEAIKLYPDEYLYLKRADLYQCLGKYGDAVKDSKAAIRIAAGGVKGYNELGYSYFKLKQFDQSIASYTETIKLDKYNSVALRGRAKSFYKQHNYDEAERDFLASLKYGATNSYTHKKLGYLYYKRKPDFPKAEVEFTKAIYFGDSNPKTLLMLVKTQRQLNDCKFLLNAKRYLTLCTDNKKCKAADTYWVESEVFHAHNVNGCAKGVGSG